MTETVTGRTGEHRLLAYRVDQHEAWINEMRDAVKSIDRSLQLLSLVEAQHVKSRTQITEMAERLRGIELELPTLRLVRGWMISGVLGVVAAVGLGVIAMAFRA